MMPHLSYVSKERPCSALLNYWILLMPAPVGQEEEQVGGSQCDQSTWNIQLWIYTSFTAAAAAVLVRNIPSLCEMFRIWDHELWHTSWYIFTKKRGGQRERVQVTLCRLRWGASEIIIIITGRKLETGRGGSGCNCIKCRATADFSLCCSKFMRLTWQSSAWQLSPLIEALVWKPGTWFEYL